MSSAEKAQGRERFVKAVIGLIVLSSCESVAFAAWTAHGPDGGVVNEFEQQGSVLRVSTADGIYQSSDAAANWSRLGDLPRGMDIHFLATSPGNAAIILATNGQTIYRSIDGGAHFSAGGPALAGLVFHPTTSNEVLGVDFNSTALYRSTDAGQTWSTVTFPDGSP